MWDQADDSSKDFYPAANEKKLIYKLIYKCWGQGLVLCYGNLQHTLQPIRICLVKHSEEINNAS